MELTGGQRWAVILLGFILVAIMAILVGKLIKGDINIPRECPVPVDKVDLCECFYDAGLNDSLRYCTCYPKGILLPDRNKLFGLINGTDGTIGNT